MIVDVTVSHKQAALCYTTISHIAEILGIQKSLPLCHHCIHHQHLHGVRKNDVTRTQGHFTNDRRRPVTYCGFTVSVIRYHNMHIICI